MGGEGGGRASMDWAKGELAALARGFRFAFAGLWLVLRTQRNAWIHACATFCTVTLGLFLGLPAAHWALLVLAVAAVWTAEALNTALERLADAAVPDPHPLIKESKDAAAAAVLVAALASIVIGVLILGPPLLAYIRSW